MLIGVDFWQHVPDGDTVGVDDAALPGKATGDGHVIGGLIFFHLIWHGYGIIEFLHVFNTVFFF